MIPFQARRFAALLAAVPLVLFASAAGAQPSSPARGEALIVSNCAMCHATGPTGASPNPKAPLFRELHQRYPVESLAEALAEGILVGHPEMPQFRFSADEVSDVIAYLKAIQTRQGAGLAPSATAAHGAAP